MKTRVKELRTVAGLTQHQLGELVHVSVRTINSIEKEENYSPSLMLAYRLAEVFDIATHVAIMRDGAITIQGPVAGFTREDLVKGLLPPDAEGGVQARAAVESSVDYGADPVLELDGFSGYGFSDVSLKVWPGEILGVAGLVGAQRTELMEGLFGLRSHTAGKITYKGQEIKINQPKDAINNGIAMLTEDRRATGILGVLSIADNVSIASLNQYLIGGFMLDDGKIEQLVQENVAKLSIKTPSSKTQIQSLSGGNQQKVLISRWLANSPDVFIMDEPTRGIDVGAKYEIYCIIAEMAKQGKSIIMISSEMSELIGMSDRIMVMCDGRVTGFIGGDEANQENIMALATQFE